MLVPNQLVEIKWNPYTQKYYQSKGYQYTKRGDSFLVKIEDLLEGSHAKVKVICDYCGKEYTKAYKDYFSQHTNGDCCVQCEGKKSLDTCEANNGKGFRGRKMREIVESRYNVDNIAKVPEIVERIKSTNIKKYGHCTVLLLPENQKKMIEAGRQESVINKRKQTNLERYGFECPLSAPEIRAKGMATYYKNGNIPTSSQQIRVYEMLRTIYDGCELNYPCGGYSLDCAVFINDIKIDVEYDGIYWHQDQERDSKRDFYVRSQGYKILRIRGRHKVPTLEIIDEAIKTLIKSEQYLMKLTTE